MCGADFMCAHAFVAIQNQFKSARRLNAANAVAAALTLARTNRTSK